MVGPDYRAAELVTPSEWRSAADQQAYEHEKAATDKFWWQNFHDPALNRLIEKALVNNLDVLQSLQDWGNARRDYIAVDKETKRFYWDLKVATGDIGHDSF